MLRILTFLILLLLLSATVGAETCRFGVVLGNNRGSDPARALRYAEQDARKMHELLLQLGDFSPQDLRLLVGASAGEAWKALREMERRVAAVSDQPGKRALFILYYSGHAEGDALELDESTLSFGELSEFLKSARADVRVAFIDSCQSGKLVAMKGGRRGPAFDIRVADEMASSGYAIITSSADNELSQESAEIRGSVFTHYLVSGLRGSGDHSADGKVTLSEAYRYAYSRTVARTAATVGGGQHPMYDFKLAGRGEIVITRIHPSRPRLLVEGLQTGRLVVVNQSREIAVAETDVSTGQAVRLTLPPGEFLVYFLSSDSAHSARVRVLPGRETRLGPDDFTPQSLDRAVAKGGLFRRTLQHTLGSGFLLRSFPLLGEPLAMGASIHYRIGHQDGWQATARLTMTTAPDAGTSTDYLDIGASGGFGYAWPVGVTWLRADLLIGYEHLFQKDLEGEGRHTSGLSYLALAGLGVPLGPLVAVLELGAGGRVFQMRGEGWVHRLDLQVILGLGWKWKG
jgi:hypothetical protein